VSGSTTAAAAAAAASDGDELTGRQLKIHQQRSSIIRRCRQLTLLHVVNVTSSSLGHVT